MNIVYLSENMGSYTSAFYQYDVMRELESQADVFFYGPGFSSYDHEDSIDDVLSKADLDADCLIVGHSWLNDSFQGPLVKYPHIDLRKDEIPKAIILNKEYARLEEKLSFVREYGFGLAFSHHHRVETYQKASGINFRFWPLAVDDRLFNYSGESKSIDVGFSGILQNTNIESHTALRVRIMRELFVCIRDLPLWKRDRFADREIFWNGKPRDSVSSFLNRMLKRYRYLDRCQYSQILRASKTFINTQSPMGIISTRYFECMASKALVVCEENPAHKLVFDGDVLMEFSTAPECANLIEKALNDEPLVKEMVDAAFDQVMSNHTWRIRIRQLLSDIEKLL